MTEWKTYRLGDIATMKYGKLPPKNNSGRYPIWSGYRNVGLTDTYNCGKGTIIVVARGVGGTGDVKMAKEDCFLTNLSIAVNLDENICNPQFFYYKFLLSNLKYLDSGSAQSQITIDDLKRLQLSLPSLEEQRRIAGILGAIDDKIECNRRINANLESQALYKQWFVDNRNDDWETKPLSEIIIIYDSQRKPLSGQQREKMDKVYPYYGAASLMDYVDGYLFDGIYLLLGEDGTVVDELGFPILQYVWGKFWVNNHAHILTGKNGFSTETLYVLLKQTSVKSIVTGAVQPKISQANLKNISVTIPPVHQLSKYNEVIEPLFKTIRKNNDESSRLATLRDTLLPKLMNGEVKL